MPDDIIAPVVFTWSGAEMQPLQRFHNLVNEQYVVGELYRLVPVEDRSMANHNHFFASVAEGWKNLPEDTAERFPTPEALRKYALIKAGYADERSIVCGSKAEAARVAAFVRPMDEYAIVVVSQATVKVYTAQSQSMRAMGRKAFQESKDAVLGVVSEIIGTEVGDLRANAGRAA